MTFNEFESRISAYIDGELDPVEQAEMERKAAECERCRTLLEDVQKITERLEQLPQLQPSAEFNFALRSHLSMEVANEQRALPGVRRVLFSSTARKLTTLAAAVILGLGLAQVFDARTPSSPQVAVEESEIQLVPGTAQPSHLGALELERLSKQSYSLDSRLYRDSTQIDSAVKQISPIFRNQGDVKQVPVSYSF